MRWLVWGVLGIGLSACSGDNPDKTDADGDGYVASEDCDDTNASIHPDAEELCDAIDNNCDDVIDTDAVDATPFFADTDGDTFGDASSEQLACDAPEGFVVDNTDCDDTNAAVNPGAVEVCDGDNIDEDCDGAVNDDDKTMDPESAFDWYLDRDEDGYGRTDGDALVSCADPSDASNTYSKENTDCNDSNPDISPGATEICDSLNIDEDCDGNADNLDDDPDPTTQTTYYADADMDTFGDATDAGTLYCDDPSTELSKFSLNAADCDDTNPAISPNADEICDDADVDEDCDGVADDNDDSTRGNSKTKYHVDADKDGYGELGRGSLFCEDPSTATDAWSTVNTDCDDANAAAYPGATEVIADAVDQDCDGGEVCYVNADDDGYRIDTTVASTDVDCDDSGEALATLPTGDCDDTNRLAYPGATELVGDGIDQSCDGTEVCFQNGDSDSYRTDLTVASADTDCDDAGEALATMASGDCDDTDPLIYPGATETVGDGIDQSCDGTEVCYENKDTDGYRTDVETTSSDTDCTDPGEALASLPSGDCDDDEASVYPGATEIPQDGIDQDCDRIDAPYMVSDLAVGELIVTEIMYNPAAVNDSAGEWFEVYNNSGGTVNLDGLIVKDNASSFTVSSTTLEFDDGEYVVFGINGTTTTNGGVPVDYDYSGPALSNSGDVVSLEYSTTVFDSVTYTSSWPGGSGISMSLCPEFTDSIDNDTKANWTDAESSYGAGDLGTPGDENDAC